ncbi:MAG: Gfo/Idh/MocA family oxidoreductase [Microbacteriaceae bacterium]|nr:Gfo/Idh/MocA family oxidoreductase [Microbacteriaceae bacterium]
MSNGAPLRAGIIGFGLAGRVFHAPFLATNPAFTIAAIATSDAHRATQAKTAHPGAEIMTTDALLERAADLDLVVLASPPHVHREQAIAALEAGSALVVDKPFAPSVADAEAIIAAADAAQRPLTVFQNRRWDGDFRTVTTLVNTGALGTVHRFESTFERFGAPKRDQWQGQISPTQGGGILFDLGSHLIDQALTLFGPATLEVAELRAVREGLGSEDDAFISLLHDSGVRSHLTMSRVAAQSGPRFRVLGDASGYSVSGLDGQEPDLKVGRWPGSDGYGETPTADWGLLGIDNGEQPLVPVPTEQGGYPDFYAQVAASIRDGAPVPVDARHALETVRIIEQAHAMAAR